MEMNILTANDQGFMDMVRKDLKRIENRGTSKAETLADLRDTKGKSFRTADLEKLMEKYDPDSYAEYSKIAKDSSGARTKSGLTYLSKWMDGVKKGLKDGTITADKTSAISEKNEAKLSSKAQEFLENLRAQYGEYDFLIGNKTDDLKALAKSGSKEFTIIFSNAELERMAKDEKYAQEKMQSIQGAVRMSKQICEENGFISAFGNMQNQNGFINKISLSIDDHGGMKIFAELEKILNQQHSAKWFTVMASSPEELLEKIRNQDWNTVSESHPGQKFDFTV